MPRRNMFLQRGDIVSTSFTNVIVATSTDDPSMSLPDVQDHEDILPSSSVGDIGTAQQRFSEERDGVLLSCVWKRTAWKMRLTH